MRLEFKVDGRNEFNSCPLCGSLVYWLHLIATIVAHFIFGTRDIIFTQHRKNVPPSMRFFTGYVRSKSVRLLSAVPISRGLKVTPLLCIT